MKVNYLMALIEESYPEIPAAKFNSIEDAVKIACSALKYLEEHCEFGEEEDKDAKI